jgi:subfamily B ATP-binding cassette protein MsbA
LSTQDERAPAEPEKAPKLSVGAVTRMLALAWPYRALLSVAGLLMLLNTLISLSLPLVARYGLDRVLKSHNVADINVLAGSLMGLVAVGAVFGYLDFILVAFVGNRIVVDMRCRLFAHLQRMPVGFFDRTRSGDLASRLSNDVSLLQSVLTDNLIRLASNALTLIGGLVVAIHIDWKLTGVVVLVLGATLAMFVVFGRRVRRLTREQLDALSDAMGAMTEALSNVRLVKAFAREPYEDTRASGRLGKVLRLAMRSSMFEGALGTIGAVAFIAVLVGVVWYGGRSVLIGRMSGGSLLGFFVTVMIISGPMSSIASLYSQLQRAIGAADRLFSILDDPQEAPDEPNAGPFPSGAGHLRFEEVHFRYDPQVPVLLNLTLDVPAGCVTAVVGASGAGKTTLASLLYRFYEPQEGAITIDGIPIRDIRRTDLRENIGLVPQEPILFNGTIRENIRYGRLSATDEEIERAAEAANVAEFVSALPNGYETLLGERGITLSGGQRQRVAIARAVLKDPRILVLDEATSALDTRSELLVREALERLMRGRTTLVIAHRLSTIQNADQIAVIDDGRIAELGTHLQLLRLGNRYAALHNLMPSEKLEPAAATNTEE